ncbi:MAG: DUF4159 domain-containing protein [Tepidisphaeraceae bacterium]|jgi:hypothetical protein
MHWLTLSKAIFVVAALGGLIWPLASGALHAPSNTPPRPVFRPGINRRLWTCISAAFCLHLALVAPSLLQIGGCRHDRPLGIPGGSGDRIARGKPDGTLGGTDQSRQAIVKARTIPESAAARRQAERGRMQYMQRISRDGLLQLLKSRDHGEVELNAASELAATLDSVGSGDGGPLGLAQGEGTGPTAAGSPWGTRIGAKLWLYRVKYTGGDWAANPRALPALLREVKLVANIPVANQQETITLAELAHHRGAYMPSMLFMTGTSHIAATDIDIKNLRDYLLGGGMLVADSSGGDFEARFTTFIGQVLPGRRMRAIEHDHEVYRGRYMPYKLPRGCPIYREHGSPDARGIFADDGRLMVFFSPGDMGSAWAVVDLGKKRGTVEQAFQMGTNLVLYSLMHVRDARK